MLPDLRFDGRNEFVERNLLHNKNTSMVKFFHYRCWRNSNGTDKKSGFVSYNDINQFRYLCFRIRVLQENESYSLESAG